MIVNIKSKTGLSGFYVVFRGSTNIETPGNLGLSHLLEHLITKSYDDLSDDFDRDGIDSNAWTSSSDIVFYIKGLDEMVIKWRDIFLDRILKYEPDENDFEGEKKIVLEEYYDTFNSQETSHLLNLERKLFNRYNPIGLGEDIRGVNFLECIKFFERQFLKPSLIISVSNKKFKRGDISFSEEPITTNLEMIMGNVDYKLESTNDFRDKSSIILLTDVLGGDFPNLEFANLMLSYGLKSPLYQEVREKRGMAYWVNSNLYKWSQNQGIGYISTSTMNVNVDEVVGTIKKILENPKKFLTRDRFNVVKDLMMVKRKKNDILRYNNVYGIIDGENWDLENKLEKIDYNSVLNSFKNIYNPDTIYVSIDKNEFLK